MIHFPEDVTWVINFNRIVRTGVRWCVLFSGDPLCTGTFLMFTWFGRVLVGGGGVWDGQAYSVQDPGPPTQA